MEHMEITKRTLRQFGLMVGGIFLLIGLWPFVWRQETVRIWAVIPGSLLAVAGLIMPGVLKYVYQGWMWVGHVMGWVNTRIILGVLFYGVVTPMGLVMKFTGRDPMRRKFEPDAQTYRVIREPRPASHMKNMFQQDAEKVHQRRSRIAQRLNVPKRTPRLFARCGLAGRPF